MWIEGFHALFKDATTKRTGRPQELSRVEEELSQSRREWRVGKRELDIIETSSAWDYPKWWPRLSKEIEGDIALPTDISSTNGKRAAIASLHSFLKNIEIISVVLRFMCPEEFGIVSPPVTSFLCLFPSPNPVRYYLNYLDILKAFVKHYGVFERVADIDMALWSASHLSLDPAQASLSEEMRNDEFLQETRIANVVANLRVFWRRSDLQRLVFARKLIEHDYILGSVIAARVYESVLRKLLEHYGVVRGDFENIRLDMIRELRYRKDASRGGLPTDKLEELWRLRNAAVHGKLDLTLKKAESFLQGVEEVWRACSKRGQEIS